MEKKMKNVFIFIVCLFFMLPISHAADLKIGVVEIARILEESPQAEAARSALQEEFAPREERLVNTQKKIREIEEKLVRDGAIMSESERTKLEREVLSKKRDFKRNQDEFRDDLNFKRNEILETLQRKLVTSIQKFAKDQKYDVLFAEGVIYASDAYNITQDVLDKLKKDAK